MAAHHVVVPVFDGVQPLARCGFGSAETMRKAFLRRVGGASDHYRRRFDVAPLTRGA